MVSRGKGWCQKDEKGKGIHSHNDEWKLDFGGEQNVVYANVKL